MSIKAPNGHDIVGWLTYVPGIVQITDVAVVDAPSGYPSDRTIDFLEAGETEMLWDEMTQPPFCYQMKFVDASGDIWTEREILDGNHPVQPE